MPCFTRIGKRVTVENGLDSFKMIDNASALLPWTFPATTHSGVLGSDSNGASPHGNHLQNLTVLALVD